MASLIKAVVNVLCEQHCVRVMREALESWDRGYKVIEDDGIENLDVITYADTIKQALDD